MNKHITLMARLVFAFLLLCGLAPAGTIIEPTGVDWNRGESIWIKEDGVDTQAYFAGVVFIALQQNGQEYDRDTLCVDLFTNIYLGVEYGTQLLHPDEVSGKNLGRVSWLVDNALLPTQNSPIMSVLPTGDWVESPSQGAGIQLAIWDIVHDDGDGFSAGRVQAAAATDPSVLSWAEEYEGLSAGQQSGLAVIYSNTNLETQQPVQMLAGPGFADNGPQPNPEPATLLLSGTALIGISVLLRRRLRRNRAAA